MFRPALPNVKGAGARETRFCIEESFDGAFTTSQTDLLTRYDIRSVRRASVCRVECEIHRVQWGPVLQYDEPAHSRTSEKLMQPLRIVSDTNPELNRRRTSKNDSPRSRRRLRSSWAPKLSNCPGITPSASSIDLAHAKLPSTEKRGTRVASRSWLQVHDIWSSRCVVAE